MKKPIIFPVLFFSFLLTAHAQVKPDYLVSSHAFGKITAATTLSSLQKVYGKMNVKDATEDGPEGGEPSTITLVFGGTKNEIRVSWVEGKLHKKIAAAETTTGGAPYSTADGLKTGTTLKTMLQVNKAPINFSGTGWDYGGYISSYNKGKLAGGNVYLRLTSNDKVNHKLLGDVKLSTNMSLVKANLENFTIESLSVTFSNG